MIEATDEVLLDHGFEGVFQAGKMLGVGELGALDHRGDEGPALGGADGTNKEVVLVAQHYRPHGPFDDVGINLDAAVIDESGQIVPGARYPRTTGI